MTSSRRRINQPNTGECLTPNTSELNPIILSKSDIERFASSERSVINTASMDPNVLQEIAQSVKSLGNRQTVGQIIELKKVSFDGSSADAFAKWLLLINDIYLSIDKDDA